MKQTNPAGVHYDVQDSFLKTNLLGLKEDIFINEAKILMQLCDSASEDTLFLIGSCHSRGGSLTSSGGGVADSGHLGSSTSQGGGHCHSRLG